MGQRQTVVSIAAIETERKLLLIRGASVELYDRRRLAIVDRIATQFQFDPLGMDTGDRNGGFTSRNRFSFGGGSGQQRRYKTGEQAGNSLARFVANSQQTMHFVDTIADSALDLLVDIVFQRRSVFVGSFDVGSGPASGQPNALLDRR